MSEFQCREARSKHGTEAKGARVKRSENTQMGGKNEAFCTTQWTQIFDARTLDPDRQQQTVDAVVEHYWKPVYCYLRRKGFDNDKTKDLTQGFFHEVVLGRDLVTRADRAKGKFRTFLLTALDRYIVSDHRGQTAMKRTPSEGLVALENVDSVNIPDRVGAATPDQVFAYAWATDLLDAVLAEVKAYFCDGGKTMHWDIFHATVVQPCLESVDPPPLSETCERFGLDGKLKACNMAITVKRRFQRVLWAHVRAVVDSDDDVEAEITELMEIFSAGRA